MTSTRPCLPLGNGSQALGGERHRRRPLPGIPRQKNADATRAAVAGYRAHMALYAPMRALELWYQRIDAAKVAELHFHAVGNKPENAPAHGETEHLLPKLTEGEGEMRRIKEQLPLVFRPRKGDRTISHVPRMLARYRATLPADRRALLERFELVDVAIKVVGVGSVGTRCAVVLLMASDSDSLFLQLKEARASVLEPIRRTRPGIVITASGWLKVSA